MTEKNISQAKSSKFTKRTATLDMAFIAMSTALIAVCSWISVPTTIPFTLQTFAIFTIAGLFGAKRGSIAVILHILLGAIGLPVFAGFKSGIAAILGPTGGYMVGFIFIALIVGFSSDKFGRKMIPMVTSMLLGLLILYAFGTVWFMTVYAKNTGAVGLGTALTWCVFPYIIPDCAKMVCACILCNRVGKYIKA